MGLSITSGDEDSIEIFQGAYSAFYRFREFVSQLICSGGVTKNAVNNAAYKSFMSHSDCEGEWTWQECRDLEAMLRPKLKDVSKSADGGGHLGNMHAKLETFLDGLAYCVEHKVAASFH